MLSFYSTNEGVLRRLEAESSEHFPQHALWIDVYDPTAEEEAFVERVLRLDIPTREEMAQIEESARFYEERGALFMTADIITGISERRPAIAEVTFVLTRKHLVTVRYADPLPFRTFAARCERQPEAHTTSDLVFASLLENIVNRIADVLEQARTAVAGLGQEIFSGDAREAGSSAAQQKRPDLQAVVKELGRNNTLIAMLRKSLLGLSRVLTYLRQAAMQWLQPGTFTLIDSIERDVRSLGDYENQMSLEISFLLSATMGLISIEQNNIIKVFSVAAVLFLPPTLVATVYGMNFKAMPELSWPLGYPFALALMVISALVPYFWFKRRRWL
jgi:magnesium transporter